jgi:predicted helicase
MSQLNLKPTHAAVKDYYAALNQLGQLHFDNEAQVSDAFAKLLTVCGRKLHLTFIPQFPIERPKSRVIVDGALLDTFHLAHGYWEAKDEKDDLDREIKSKLDKGYPHDNIIFQAPERAVLYQGSIRVFDENISRPEALVQVVNAFFDYKAGYIQEWEQAVSEFSERIKELAGAVFKTIEEERRKNPPFVRSFDDFYALCRQAINPDLSTEAVERMLVQHLLTERIFRKIFKNPDFTRRNVIAQEIEKVIAALTSRSFNRDEFLGKLDRFYHAIEQSAENTTGFSEKQHFLNTVYQRFFQDYSRKEADTHGIVYTPQSIVNFMVRSVEEILKKEFGRSLGDKGVHILDPFVGTGNFIVHIMEQIRATDLTYKYENELHCNEVMLLPYYIASMNIEHAYIDRTGEYKVFPGICMVDTFELAEPEQAALSFMTVENAERVKRQKESPIFVIIGNPPYNTAQVNENDSNKNRKYPTVDKRVRDTYARASDATLLNKLSDPYVKAIRWASDRLVGDGVVALVTNNSFINQIAFDGMRSCLETEFDSIYLLDLGGNVRRNPKLSGTTHNVFGIQVGVSINILIRKKAGGSKRKALINYFAVEPDWRKEQKYSFLEQSGDRAGVDWQIIHPDNRHSWLNADFDSSFDQLIPRGSKRSEDTCFKTYSNGVLTARDAWAYAWNSRTLTEQIRKIIGEYNSALERWEASNKSGKLDEFLTSTSANIKWTRRILKLAAGKTRLKFSDGEIRRSIYRPFTERRLFFSKELNEEIYSLRSIYPTSETESVNTALCVSGTGHRAPFSCIAVSMIPNYCIAATTDSFQCFPFYTYSEDGTNRRENITDWALEQFRSHYHDPSITKWDIFHYIYAVLHHREYRERYAANLRRELPRIPFTAAALNSCHPERSEGPLLSPSCVPGIGVPRSARDDKRKDDKSQKVSASSASSAVKDLDVFRALVKSGQRLAEIHVHYEQQPEYALTKKEKAGEKLDWRVTRMRLSKDKTTLIYNDFLTLSEIPKETYDYRLGNRSALEWVVDQYQVSTDKRSGITNDPNRADDPQYIVRLIGQVISVSLETVGIVSALPPLGLAPRGSGPIGGPSA